MENLQSEQSSILQSRLIISSQSVSVAFYMADKVIIDSLHRLQDLYMIANRDPFPIKVDHFNLVTQDELADRKTIFGRSAFCNTDERDHELITQPVKRM